METLQTFLELIFWVLVVVGIFYGFNLLFKKSDNSVKHNNTNGLARLICGDYLGGIKDIEAPRHRCYLNFLQDYLEVQITLNTPRIENDEVVKYEIEKIKRENIIDAEIISETNLKEKINLGKILIFGIYSLFMKDTVKEIKNYMLINYLKDGVKCAIIFDCSTDDDTKANVRYLNLWKNDVDKAKNLTLKELYEL